MRALFIHRSRVPYIEDRFTVNRFHCCSLMSSLVTFLAWALALAFLPLIVLLWATESPAQRVARWHRSDLPAAEIADRSRRAMRQALILSTVEA